jgi:hypothetical protein
MMNGETKAILYKSVKRATEYNGRKTSEKAIEEFEELIAELEQATERMKCGLSINNVLEIVDEIADVIITLEQNTETICIQGMIADRVDFKLDRLLQRYKDGELWIKER